MKRLKVIIFRVRECTKRICISVFIISFCKLFSINLEDRAQDIVIHTHRITIPEYPHAFNPSIVRWNNELVLSFRVILNVKEPFKSWIGITRLDDTYEPQGAPQLLPLRNPQSRVPSRAEDGRLITIGNRLYLIYTDNEDVVISKMGYRMYIAEIGYKEGTFGVHSIERLFSYEGNETTHKEKSWVPFDHRGQLLLSYTIVPHKILLPLLGTGHCQSLISTQTPLPWNWGELRGGTPALLDGDRYIAFFHSSIRMKTEHSQGKEVPHYFMGAYTFMPNSPFTITHISKEPIIGKQFYTGQEYERYWGSVRVVFPCGLMADDQYFWIAYGRQDHEMWIAQLDKKKVYANLIGTKDTIPRFPL
jgi:predicted GH43/DUF377 family glycosyl hydrolase